MSFRLPGGRAAETLRVLVVADDALARTSLERLLAGHEDLALAVASEADVVLFDAGVLGELPSRRIRSVGFGVVALVPDGHAASRMAAAGVGAVARDADAGRIAAALLAASQGLVVIDAGFAADVIAEQPEAPDALPDPLTPREREVLELLAAGLSNRRIASELGISEHTAKFHVNGILAKLGATTRTEAVVLAARAGVLML